MKKYVFTVGGVWVSEPIQVLANSLEEARESLSAKIAFTGYDVSEQEITETTLVDCDNKEGQ